MKAAVTWPSLAEPAAVGQWSIGGQNSAVQIRGASIATVSLRVGVTGGGSAGHVVPALAVAAEFRRRGDHDLVFFGRADSIEERLARQAGLHFVALPAAGLRRYRSWKNLTLPFVVIWGIIAAIIAVRREKINVLLCKGGYVSVPAAIGAWVNRVPFAIHESDQSLGLANRILAMFATKVLTSSQSTHGLGPAAQDQAGLHRPAGARRPGPGRPGAVPRGRRHPAPAAASCSSSAAAAARSASTRPCGRTWRSCAATSSSCTSPGRTTPTRRSIGIPGYHQFEYLNDDMARRALAGRRRDRPRGRDDAGRAGRAGQARRAHPAAAQRQPRRPDRERRVLCPDAQLRGAARRREHDRRAWSTRA